MRHVSRENLRNFKRRKIDIDFNYKSARQLGDNSIFEFLDTSPWALILFYDSNCWLGQLTLGSLEKTDKEFLLRGFSGFLKAATINVTANPGANRNFDITQTPTFILFYKSQEIRRRTLSISFEKELDFTLTKASAESSLLRWVNETTQTITGREIIIPRESIDWKNLPNGRTFTWDP